MENMKIRKATTALTAAVLATVLACGGLAGCAGEPQPSDAEGDASAHGVQPDETQAAANPQLASVVEDGAPLSESARAELSDGEALEVQEVLQYPELESGCEIAALVSALQALGFDATTTEIADDYLVVDGDYANGYLASPYTDFGGGFPPGIVKAANAYLTAQGSGLEAHDLTGSGFGGLGALANAGHPVLVWTTLENNAPNYDASLGAIDDWYVNEHCITVYSVENGTVLAADPLKGTVEIDADTLAGAYAQCGNMAACIY